METDFRARPAGHRTLDGGHGAGNPRARTGRLLISFPDQPAIAAAVSSFLFPNGTNITEPLQHAIDPFGGTFLARIEFYLAALAECFVDLAAGIGEPAGRFSMRWQKTMAGQHRADRLIAHQPRAIAFT